MRLFKHVYFAEIFEDAFIVQGVLGSEGAGPGLEHAVSVGAHLDVDHVAAGPLQAEQEERDLAQGRLHPSPSPGPHLGRGEERNYKKK